jgi:hypothetical protein
VATRRVRASSRGDSTWFVRWWGRCAADTVAAQRQTRWSFVRRRWIQVACVRAPVPTRHNQAMTREGDEEPRYMGISEFLERYPDRAQEIDEQVRRLTTDNGPGDDTTSVQQRPPQASLVRAEILSAIDRDLRAAGLTKISAARLVGHRDSAELAAEDDHDRGLVGLADPEPPSAAPAEALELRAAAEFAQAMLVETSYRQWPVCRLHSSRMLSPLIRDNVASWVCGATAHAAPHVVAKVGALADADGANIGFS